MNPKFNIIKSLKHLLNLFILSFMVFAFLGCDRQNHFITDRKYRKEVHQDFLSRKEIAKQREEALFSVFYTGISLKEKEALEFLYAYMPLSDLADYDGEFFLNQVRYSFKAQDFFSWGKTIPEDVFRHFVLVYRVNNENLDSARMVFFNELKDRVKEMSMYDAALEVNHWCHEKVAYRPSDERTSSPLATIKTSLGRCGEESTFTVTAMRAVGIPARQCYTPRWAHTDDNHAWVEVWIDGNWYYLGACEPDVELNMGWFDIPATRTMMVHSNAFGKYIGNEEINFKTPLYSKINMLPNYTKTKKIKIKVINLNQEPVEAAEVAFKLYNLAEFYPLATQKTNSKGEAFLTTGYGDLLIWAKKDNLYGFEPIRVREMDSLTVIIKEQQDNIYLYDMNPPDPQFIKKDIAEEKIELNKQRIAAENLMREAYMSTFPSETDCASIENDNLSKEEIWNIIQKSEGNYAEMTALMNLFKEKNGKLLLNQFFLSLSDKDLRDGTAAILSQHITYFNADNYPQEVYLKGIISPRIANEGIRPWRSYLAEKLPVELKNHNSASAIATWMEQHITIDGEANYFNCPISPIGVYELRIADRHSADIFFVAACRSLNIPAYKDNATKQVYAYENNKWVQFFVNPSQNNLKKATLILTYSGNDKQQPQYCWQYTIAKIENGDCLTFDYENDPTKSQFPVTMEVDAGTYLLTTGNRHIDGGVFSRLDFFKVNEEDTIYKEIVIRPLEVHAKSYGTISTDFEIDKSTTPKKLKDYFNHKDLIVCFIDLDVEPTKHLLKDIAAYKTLFEKWGGTMLFVCADEKKTLSFNPKKWNLPSNVVVICDEHKTWLYELKTSINYSFTDDYPLVFISNTKGDVTFLSEGYRIGTGELLFKTLQN